MNNWREANFVELPQDEYGNRLYTNGTPRVIRAKVEPGTGKPDTWGSIATLHIIEPSQEEFPWPTVNAMGWLEVDYPAGLLTWEKREELIKKHQAVYITQ